MQHRTDHSHEWCRFPVTPDHLYVGASKRDVVGLMLKTYNRKKPITEINRVNRSVQWAHVCQQLQIQTVTYLRLLCQFPGSVLSGDSSASSDCELFAYTWRLPPFPSCSPLQSSVNSVMSTELRGIYLSKSFNNCLQLSKWHRITTVSVTLCAPQTSARIQIICFLQN